jgi:hypothetical protein
MQLEQLQTMQLQNKISKINDICFDQCIRLNNSNTNTNTSNSTTGSRWGITGSSNSNGSKKNDVSELSTDEKQCVKSCTTLYFNTHGLLAELLQKRLSG